MYPLSDNDHTKSGQLRRRGQYRMQHVMMMMISNWKLWQLSRDFVSAIGFVADVLCDEN